IAAREHSPGRAGRRDGSQGGPPPPPTRRPDPTLFTTPSSRRTEQIAWRWPEPRPKNDGLRQVPAGLATRGEKTPIARQVRRRVVDDPTGGRGGSRAGHGRWGGRSHGHARGVVGAVPSPGAGGPPGAGGVSGEAIRREGITGRGGEEIPQARAAPLEATGAGRWPGRCRPWPLLRRESTMIVRPHRTAVRRCYP